MSIYASSPNGSIERLAEFEGQQTPNVPISNSSTIRLVIIKWYVLNNAF
jgi:hypothetical protein